MKVLFTTPVLEHPAAGGSQLRIENSIKALSKVCELSIIARIHKYHMGGNNAEVFYRRYCKDFFYSPSAVRAYKSRYLQISQKIYRRIFSPSDDASFIINIVNKQNIDVVWFGYGNISFPLIKEIKQLKPELKVVCDTDSVWSRFILRELPYESDSRRRADIEQRGREKEQEEEDWVNLCEVTTAVSEVDALYYRGLAKDPERISVFSNVIDFESYRNPPAPPAGFNKPCIFVGGCFWPRSPMERAVRWVIKEVLPIIKKHNPNVHLYVVGRDSNKILSDIDDPDITVTGQLPSVLPYLCNADVSIVPLTFESGTRFKILEAGACGIPIVSTTLGAEGIPVSDGQDIIIADEPGEFAQGIIKLIEDKASAEKIAKNCRALIQKHYSVDSLAREAEEILSYLRDY